MEVRTIVNRNLNAVLYLNGNVFIEQLHGNLTSEIKLYKFGSETIVHQRHDFRCYTTNEIIYTKDHLMYDYSIDIVINKDYKIMADDVFITDVDFEFYYDDYFRRTYFNMFFCFVSPNDLQILASSKSAIIHGMK